MYIYASLKLNLQLYALYFNLSRMYQKFIWPWFWNLFWYICICILKCMCTYSKCKQHCINEQPSRENFTLCKKFQILYQYLRLYAAHFWFFQVNSLFRVRKIESSSVLCFSRHSYCVLYFDRNLWAFHLHLKTAATTTLHTYDYII